MIDKPLAWAASLAAAFLLSGCGGGSSDSDSPVAGALDNTAPAVSYVTPSNNAGNVGTNTRLTITFSETMDEASLASSIAVVDDASGSAIVLRDISFDRANNIATLTLQSPLAPQRRYRAEVSTSARDLASNALGSAYAWRFDTGAGDDATAPAVTSHTPAAGATGVPTDGAVAMSFSEPMDVASVSAAFTLSVGGNAVAGRLAYVGQAAVFRPDAALSPGSTYMATLRRTAADLAGNALASDVVWSFSTGSDADRTPPLVLSVSPAIDASQVPRNAVLSVTFSEPIYPFVFGSIDGAMVEVAIDYATNTATMIPTTALRANAGYTGSASARDLAGNAMPEPYRWVFFTGP